MEVLQKVLPKVRAALGKKDYAIREVSDVREEEAEKGAKKLTLAATLQLCEGAECIEKVLEVEVYHYHNNGNGTSSAVLRKLTTLSTTTQPRPEPLVSGPGGVEASATPEATEEDAAGAATPGNHTPPSVDDLCHLNAGDGATTAAPVAPAAQYCPELSGLEGCGELRAAGASSTGLAAHPVKNTPAGVTAATSAAASGNPVVAPSPSLMALLASSLESLRPQPAPRPAAPTVLSPAVLALLRQKRKTPAANLAAHTADACAPQWPPSPSLRPSTGAVCPISMPLARHLSRLLAVRCTPSSALSHLLQKRTRHECGLEEPVAKRLRISTDNLPLEPEDVVQTPYGGIACCQLVDMLIATLSALDCTTPIGLRHRQCVQWTVTHQQQHTLHPSLLQTPVQALSLREQLMLQRGCTTPYKRPDPLQSPEKTLKSPTRSPGESMDQQMEDEEEIPPLSLTPPHSQLPAPEEVTLITPSKPISLAANSTPTNKKASHPWSTSRSYHATHAKVSPKPAAQSTTATLGALTSAKRAQMKALLEKKLTMLHTTFKRYKDQSAEVLKSSTATPAQRQEILKKIKDTTEAIKQTLEQQKQLAQSSAGPTSKHIPGLTLLDAPSGLPSHPTMGTEHTAASMGCPCPPKGAKTASPPKEELQRKVETVVRELKQTWDMDEDLLFK
eukprot:GGOE01008284.1.p1 GENE.GGOE01008284.1~~GGOE01008284.1.p1  ORF type:complete len:674 (-),score=183.74 GGOE01008284.1:259-2280(-)